MLNLFSRRLICIPIVMTLLSVPLSADFITQGTPYDSSGGLVDTNILPDKFSTSVKPNHDLVEIGIRTTPVTGSSDDGESPVAIDIGSFEILHFGNDVDSEYYAYNITLAVWADEGDLQISNEEFKIITLTKSFGETFSQTATGIIFTPETTTDSLFRTYFSTAYTRVEGSQNEKLYSYFRIQELTLSYSLNDKGTNPTILIDYGTPADKQSYILQASTTDSTGDDNLGSALVPIGTDKAFYIGINYPSLPVFTLSKKYGVDIFGLSCPESINVVVDGIPTPILTRESLFGIDIIYTYSSEIDAGQRIGFIPDPDNFSVYYEFKYDKGTITKYSNLKNIGASNLEFNKSASTLTDNEFWFFYSTSQGAFPNLNENTPSSI